MTGPESIEQAQFAASLDIDLADFTRTSSGLYYEDVEPGTGDPAASGQSVRVAYTGWLTNGAQFDSGEFAFLLGAGQVVPGFDEGVQGMRVGGIRRIIIPPELGYGNRGSGPVPPERDHDLPDRGAVDRVGVRTAGALNPPSTLPVRSTS